MTSKELTKHGQYWQSALRLTDWDIEYRFAGAMELEGSCGNNCYSRKYQHSVVSVCKPEENTQAPPDHLEDIDVTLVHELLHLYLTPLFVSTNSDFEASAQEFAIDVIARIIVNEHKASTSRKK